MDETTPAPAPASAPAAKARYRVLCPPQWTAAYDGKPPHPFGINFVASNGDEKRYEEGDIVGDFPLVADVKALVEMGALEEVRDGS